MANESSHLDLHCVHKSIVTAYGSERVMVQSKICKDNILKSFLFLFEKISVDILYESSTKRMIRMKCQELLSLKISKTKEKKKLGMSSAAVVNGAFKVNR